MTRPRTPPRSLGAALLLLAAAGCPAAGELDCAVAGCPFGQVCDDGSCRPCAEGRECGPGLACIGGRCGPECESGRGCVDGQVCRDLRCVPCVSDVECGETEACREGRCAPSCLLTCDADQVCWHGRCGGCQSDRECGRGRVCGASGRCAPAPCEADDDCGAGRVCQDGACRSRCGPDGACPRGLVCRDRQCELCRADSDCPSESRCTARGLCTEVCPMSCPAGSVCESGRCRGCAADDECVSGEICWRSRCTAEDCAEQQCGWQRSRWCGSCPAGEACGERGDCAPADRPLCWGDPVTPPGAWTFGSVVTASGVRGMFASTFHWWQRDQSRPRGARGCTRLAFVPLRSEVELDLGAMTELPASDFDFLASFDCRGEPDPNEGQQSCDGDAHTPTLRADLLEMLFPSTYPCLDWGTEELWSSHRASPDAPWSRPELVLGDPAINDGGFQNPVFLPDGRTIVFTYRRPDFRLLGGLQTATRTSTRGGTPFGPWRDVEPFDVDDVPEGYQAEFGPHSVTCDGQHLIYSRKILRWLPDSKDPLVHEEAVVRMARLVSTDPPRFADPRPYPLPPVSETPAHVLESQDCDALWISFRNREWRQVWRRAPCAR